MKRIALLLIAALAFGCSSGDDFDDDNGGGVVVVPPPVGTIEWHATLSSLDNTLYTLTGDAVVAEVVSEAAFTATITIRNDIVGSIRPWHVHFGTCATGGAIVGDDTAYPRLQVTSGGTASVNVMIRVGLDPAVAYHVNVHKSDAEFNTIIACGDMVVR